MPTPQVFAGHLNQHINLEKWANGYPQPTNLLNIFIEITEKCTVMSHGHFKYAHCAGIRPNPSHEFHNFINMFARKFSQEKFKIKNYGKRGAEK